MTFRYVHVAEREVEAAAKNVCVWNTGKLCLIPIRASLGKPDFNLLRAPNCQPFGYHYRGFL